jgi:hypothetical protein
MKEIDEIKSEAMALLHNGVVNLVDETILTPPETILVLRLVADHIQKLFETSVRGE